MKYRVLGKTGWKVSVLGFGAAPLGGTHGAIREQDGVRAVHTAIDLGINFIDVAPYYGLTIAESVLGKALREIPREKYHLATKVGRNGPKESDFDFSAAGIMGSVDKSLRRLGVSHIDLLQLQDIQYARIEQIVDESLPALMRLKRRGKVRRVGVAALPIQALRRVVERVPLDTVHSYCNFCLANTRLVQLLPLLSEHRIGVINAAPLAMGLLTEKGPPAWHPAPAAIRDGCRRAVEFCKKKKASLPKLALQFAISHREISTTLVGTADPKKVRECVKWIETDLDYSLLTEVQDVLTPIRNETWLSGRKENN